ncbi:MULTISPECIES: fimbria/pilus outer membrane usher protein [Providencia]|uniref:fimbria/pilus outer membrane usher protein n=1 Tax=Providencia TaxID=586 RepID=UPI00073B1F8D|nr:MULTISPECIES: fimbria/pilus outer membrane usher protein [Providencia]SST03348.1 outer membrane usher protein [Acinetobacter baumannii]KSX96941.1 fimbrial assembly protein [Providencia stuartii]MCX3071269.1 fimbrial biogenesis outer membrane usher protein [Providencia stuartii]MDT2014895.1 fimbrial biogenesis outer membrane usher protein [Providencia stuartii]MDT2080765.1 fimbrial biogenesis outer membrane usher protein [Providencia stuartii]
MNRLYHKKYPYSPLFMAIVFASLSFEMRAADYYPPSLLNIAGTDTQLTNEDLDVFRENDIAPGKYHVRFFINNNLILNKEISFVMMPRADGGEQLTPCFSFADWESFGIDFHKTLKGDQECFNINDIEYMTQSLDLNTKVYSMTVPQSMINQQRIRKAEEAQWDDGIPAVFLNYSFSAFNTYEGGKVDDNYYGNIQTKINIGSWRYRNYSTWANNRHDKNKWNNISNTLSRNINIIKSELTLGDLYTSSQLFDSFKFKGVKLASDRQMEPYNLTSYAPSVNGIANSESIVTIVQNDQVIYKKSVPAGPFEITDYYPMSNGGNLYVTVEEANGNEVNSIVPFSSIAFLERKGSIKYSFSSGEYDGNNNGDGRYVNEAEIYYGLTDFVTVFGGALYAKKYQSYAIGTGFNLGEVGAITTDVVHSRTDVDNQSTLSGNAFRVNYSKHIETTNTSLALAGFRHFDADFMNIDDAFSYEEKYRGSYEKLKNEYTVSLSQPILDSSSSINLNSVVYEYSSGHKQQSYNVGFNSNIDKVHYSVYYTYSKGRQFENDNSRSYNLSLNVSIPFDVLNNTMSVNYGISTDDQHRTSQTARLSGSYGELYRGTWDIYQGYGNKGMGYSGGLSSSYRSPYAVVNAGYAYNDSHKNFNYGISGAFVGTQYGVVLAPSMQDTSALILTKGTQGVGIINGQSVETNAYGLAIVPGMAPYRKNTLAIDTKTIPQDTEIENNIINNVIPTKGALILADFDAKKGYKLLFKLQHPTNKELPVGAKAVTEDEATHLVSNFNTLYLVADKPKGRIKVNWKNEGANESCDVDYNIENTMPTNGLYILNSECR